MIISSASLLTDTFGMMLRLLVLCAVSAVFASVVHGWFQAVAATFLGDQAPRAQGRLLGNPLRHLHPVGSLLATMTGFGWAKPLPGPPNRHGRWPSVAIAAAGPLGNITVAFLLATPIKAGVLSWTAPSPDSLALVMTGGLREGISDVIGLLVVYNLLMAAFQVLPFAPLAGYRALAALLPTSVDETHQKFQRFAPALLVILIAFSYVIPPGILWPTILRLAQWLGSLATGY
jgi:Zn-dependent protease